MVVYKENSNILTTTLQVCGFLFPNLIPVEIFFQADNVYHVCVDDSRDQD